MRVMAADGLGWRCVNLRFYFVRHPETYANKYGLIYGWKDYAYTEKGHAMFEQMPARLDDYKFDRIYSSPLGRAKKLAEAVGERRNMPVKVDERIKEMNFGILEGIPYRKAQQEYPDVVDRIFGDLNNFTVPEGENTADVTARAASFLDEIKEEDGSVLIITHSMFMHTTMSYLLDLPREDMWHFKIDPCMIVRIDYKDGFGVLKGMIPFEETDDLYIVDVR